MNDPALAVAAARPASRDLGQQYLSCRLLIRRYLAARLRQRTLVDDMTQEVFVRALRSRQRCGCQADSPQYLMGIAKNVLREYLRRQTVERKALAGLARLRPREVRSPHRGLDDQELHDLLENAQAQLTPLQRPAVLCVWREGVPPAQAAQHLRCSCKAVCRRLEAARERLRLALWPHDEFGDSPGFRPAPHAAPAPAVVA